MNDKSVQSRMTAIDERLPSSVEGHPNDLAAETLDGVDLRRTRTAVGRETQERRAYRDARQPRAGVFYLIDRNRLGYHL